MINFKTSKEKIAALTLTTLIMSACSTQIGTNTSIGTKTSADSKTPAITTNLTPDLANIEMQKAAYESYLKEQEQKLQEPASYNVLRPADFKIGSFDTKATNLSVNDPGFAGNAVLVTVGSTTYTLSYPFMRKLRLALMGSDFTSATGVADLLTLKDYNLLTSGMVDGDGDTVGTTTDQSSYKASVSETAFITLLKTYDSVTMPNFLQGYDSSDLETNDPASTAIVLNPAQATTDGYTVTTSTLSFISDGKSPAIRTSFYQAIYAAAGSNPFILTGSEINTLKTSTYLPGASVATTASLPNTTELAFLNGLSSQVTDWDVVLVDGTQTVQTPIDIEIGFGNSQVPGSYTAGTQTALNIVQNVGVVNRNVDGTSSPWPNSDLVTQVPALTALNHPAGTNYAPAAAVLAAELLLQSASSGAAANNINPGSTSVNFNDATTGFLYTDLVTTPALGSPVTFGNVHSIMRKIHEDNIGAITSSATDQAKAKAGLKFSFLSTAGSVGAVDTSKGLGFAFANAKWNSFNQYHLPKTTTASTQNQSSVVNFLSDVAFVGSTTIPAIPTGTNLANLAQKKVVYAECTRSAAGGLSFASATTVNSAVLIKYEVTSSGNNVLFVYDPGMPNNPDTPGTVHNYRPMTDAEKLALWASPIQMVGLQETDF